MLHWLETMTQGSEPAELRTEVGCLRVSLHRKIGTYSWYLTCRRLHISDRNLMRSNLGEAKTAAEEALVFAVRSELRELEQVHKLLLP